LLTLDSHRGQSGVLLALSTHLLCQAAPFRKQDCGAFASAGRESAFEKQAVSKNPGRGLGSVRKVEFGC
jgi:hypothetical protein